MNLGSTAALSHPGRRRRHNEDAYVVEPPLFAVADGMGGAKAGEVASGLAASAVQESGNDGQSGEARVEALISEANRRVFMRASEDREASGMGTTMTVALVEDDRVAFGHVGDSRAYLIRDGQLEQLTDDHSLVAELVRSGRLTPEEAETHPQRSVITRALGTEADVDVDTFSIPVEPGDLFLLCSDGLTSMVDDQTILGAVEANRGNLEEAAKALVNAANRGGGEDNITVVFFEVRDEPAAETADTVRTASLPDENTMDESDGQPPVAVAEPAPEKERRGRVLPFFGALAVLLIMAAAILWLLGQS
jgi:PPM family protein phosphatase